MVALALYQPDIAANAGAMLRLAACLGVATHVIGPAGFDFSDRALKRAGMDYLDRAEIARHDDWTAFLANARDERRRVVLLTTRAPTAYVDFPFAETDLLLLGRESAGVPEAVHAAVDERILIPMAPGLRSLNIVTAAAIVLGEALRQTGGFPRHG